MWGGGYEAAGPQDEQQRDAAELLELYQRLSKRRLEALAVARAMNVTEVEASAESPAADRAEGNLGMRDDARSDFERCVELDANNDAGKSCSRYLEATY